MPQYIRAFVPGGTFFFTVTLLERRRKLVTENIDNLREVFMAGRQRKPFNIEAIVMGKDFHHGVCRRENGAFGSDAFGNMSSVMRVTMSVM
jgi:REP element-mobilizing transposase RayT